MGILRDWIALGFCLAVLFGVATPLPAQTPQPGEQVDQAAEAMRPKPDMAGVELIRFLTDNDYPPFNYLDEEGALTGFNVDLAHALCDELVVECDVRSADWSTLVPALENGDTDAVVASIRTTPTSLIKLDFTDPYYYTPARFVGLKGSPAVSTDPAALAGKKVAVVKGSPHAAYLSDFFDAAEVIPFETIEKAQAALTSGQVDLLFGDGIALMFWLNGTASQNCCEFRSGPYAESRYFGAGVGIAVRRGNRKLRNILDYGLERLRISGRLEELYLRYFPLSFF